MRFRNTIVYILLIVLVNYGISYAPYITVLGAPFSSADAVIGIIYIFRDLAQRELKHFVFIAMFIGCLLSYFLADKTVAIASITAFSVGELIDWSIYTFTKRPLSKRLLWSASFSAPIDTAIFLHMIHQYNIMGFIMMNAGKMTGVLIIWYLWRKRQSSNMLVTIT
jgi:queuosine precursor transporter